MKNNNYADFSDQLSNQKLADNSYILLGVDENQKVVFGEPTHFNKPSANKFHQDLYLYQIKGGAGTGSNHAIKAMVTAMCEHTDLSACIISSTDYSKLANGVDFVYIKPTKKKAQEIIKHYQESTYDVFIVDNLDSLAGLGLESLLEGCIGGELLSNIIAIDKSFQTPDITYDNKVGSTVKNKTIELMWVPLGETLPNYFDLASLRRQQREFSNRKKDDYLKNIFDFKDYASKLLPNIYSSSIGFRKSDVNLNFGIGVGYNSEIVNVDMSDYSTLTIGASSGSGYSYLLRSLLLQLTHHNHPDDLHLFYIEPKRGLEMYSKIPHAKTIIGSWVKDYSDLNGGDYGQNYVSPFILGVQDAYNWLEKESVRRIELYSKYSKLWGETINTLQDARSAALRHADKNHELFLPAIILIGSSATQFLRKEERQSLSVKEKQILKDIRDKATSLFLRSRALGIHTIYFSHAYSDELFPIMIKNNSLNIGMRVNTERASKQLVGDDSLFNLGPPGRGILFDLQSGEEIDFRTFLVNMGEVERTKNGEIVHEDYFEKYLNHLNFRDKELEGWVEGYLEKNISNEESNAFNRKL